MLVGRERRIGQVATLHGFVGLGTCVSLIVFFIVGGAFGAINDVGNAVLGLLSAALAWLWPGARRLAVIAAFGAAITVVGSVLILTDTTGFFLAGLVSSVGFALIGVWLVAVNRELDLTWSRQVRRAGLIAGVVMLLGFINAPGVAMGADDMDAAPIWTYLGGLSWAGTYLLFPVWSLSLKTSVPRPD